MGQARDRIDVRGRCWLLAGGLLAAALPGLVGCQRRAASAPQVPLEPERKSSPVAAAPRPAVARGAPAAGSPGFAAVSPAEVRGVSGAAASAPTGRGDEAPGPQPETWGAATDLLVYVTLDVPGRLPASAVLRVDLADASDIGGPVRTLATRELSVSHGDRLQVTIAVPTDALRRTRRLALSARVEGRRGRDLLAITTVPLVLRTDQIGDRLELWVRALPSYERDPEFEPWLLSPEEMRGTNDARTTSGSQSR